MASELPKEDSMTIRQIALQMMPQWNPEDWLRWPPDAFALTSILLKTTGLYRYAVTEHPESNIRISSGKEEEQWKSTIKEWHQWISAGDGDVPPYLLEIQNILFDSQNNIHSYCERITEKTCQAILKLHALADSTCAGFGLFNVPFGPGSAIYYLSNTLLEITGSLSRLPRRYGVVLPKMRTPQGGLTMRSFSHHLSFHQSEVNARWCTIPWVNQDEANLNILAIPMPYKVSSLDFSPDSSEARINDAEGFAYFDYKPSEVFNPQHVIDLIKSCKEVRRIHLVVLPELALTEKEFESLKRELIRQIKGDQMPMIIAGLRTEEGPAKNERTVNQVVLSVFFASRWYDLKQDKHHRWRLDSHQIIQYQLANLDTKTSWWENIPVRPRRLTFLTPNSWLTLCPLICEDLAQLEPVSEVIRGVGPTLVVAILMDGPQLPDRWSARYVGVLNDDPGSSVLTLTSLGMASKARARGTKEDHTVALWMDMQNRKQPIVLSDGAEAVLLTVGVNYREEFTADGRSDGGASAVFDLRWVHQIRRDADLGRSNKKAKISPEGSPAVPAGTDKTKINRLPVDATELTIFAHLTEAVLDAEPELANELMNCTLMVESAKVDQTGNSISSDCVLIKNSPLLKDIKGRIDSVLRDDLRFANGDTWPRFELKGAVEELRACLLRVNAMSIESPEQKDHDRWTALLKITENGLEELQQVSNETRTSGGAQSPRSSSKRPSEIAYLSILWAIHNRVVDHRKRKLKVEQKAEWDNLLTKINKCVERFSEYFVV